MTSKCLSTVKTHKRELSKYPTLSKLSERPKRSKFSASFKVAMKSRWSRARKVKHRRCSNTLSPRNCVRFFRSLNRCDHINALEFAFERISDDGSVRRYPSPTPYELDSIVIPPSSRSIFMNVPYRLQKAPFKDLLSECLIATCYDNDGDEAPAQIIYRAIDTLQIARNRFGSHICCSFLKWRFETGVLLVALGLVNLGGINATAVDGLKLSDDGPILPGSWYREGPLPTMFRNLCVNSYVKYCWGPQVIAETTRNMCNA